MSSINKTKSIYKIFVNALFQYNNTNGHIDITMNEVKFSVIASLPNGNFMKKANMHMRIINTHLLNNLVYTIEYMLEKTIANVYQYTICAQVNSDFHSIDNGVKISPMIEIIQKAQSNLESLLLLKS